MMTTKMFGLSFLVALGAVGCAATPAPQGNTDDRPAGVSEEQPDFEDVGDPNETFTQTLVSVKDDGTVETRSSTITRGQQWQIRRQEREAARAVSGKSSFGQSSDLNTQFKWTKVAPNQFGVCDGTGNLVLWDEENYVGNQICFSYSANYVFDQQSGTWIPLFSPGLDLSGYARGLINLCGVHTWWETDRSCVYSGGTWHWQNDYTPAFYYLRALSAKNNTTGAAIFSTSASRNAGTNTTVYAGTQNPTLWGGTARYLKALP